MRQLVIDGFLSSSEVVQADACWPLPSWPGWVRYDSGKIACDVSTPLPVALSALLCRMAAAGLGALVGLPESAADLTLWGGGLHAMPRGSALGVHQDADVHPRLRLLRAWSAVLYVHAAWDPAWGGDLVLDAPEPVQIAPRPGRLAVFDCREVRHHVTAVRCPEGAERRSLALFGYLPRQGPGLRPRALFEAAGQGAAPRP